MEKSRYRCFAFATLNLINKIQRWHKNGKQVNKIITTKYNSKQKYVDNTTKINVINDRDFEKPNVHAYIRLFTLPYKRQSKADE